MGYSTRPGSLGHTIRTFWPDDDAESFFISYGASLSEIMDKAKVKWPDGGSDLRIDSEYLHTDCLGYDLYDPSDYTHFLCITRIKE